MAAKYEADAAARRSGVIDATLERFGIEGRRPIAQHVAEYNAPLASPAEHRAARGALTVAHIEAVIRGCAERKRLAD